MVDKKSIKLSPYEFFCKYRNRRSVAVITDKQYIFYSQILDDDYRSHDNIVVDIETTIHPSSLREGWDAFRSNNLYTFGVGTGYFRIDFPDNKELSMNQVTFLLELLKKQKLHFREFIRELNFSLFSFIDLFRKNYLL